MDEQTAKKIKSSKNDNQSTPQWLFDFLHDLFDFDIDVCASAENAKCDVYFDGTPESDGLLSRWSGEMHWCNPPFSRPENACRKNCTKKACEQRGHHLTERKPGMIDWCEKAIEEYESHQAQTVILTPIKTDTKAFDQHLSKASAHLMLKGRLKFNGAQTGALQPSMISFVGIELTEKQKTSLSEIGHLLFPWKEVKSQQTKTKKEWWQFWK